MNSSLIDEEIARWWIDFFKTGKKNVSASRDCQARLLEILD